MGNLFDRDYIILDGAMGTMLQQQGMELGVVPETLNITKPEWIVDIHGQYINAGSDVVYANTFGANRYKMKDTGYTVEELISAAIKNAKTALNMLDTLPTLTKSITIKIGTTKMNLLTDEDIANFTLKGYTLS